MTLENAVQRLKSSDEFKAVLTHLTTTRENALDEFKRPETIENPQALANLAGKIEMIDTILIELGGPSYPNAEH
jgi:hypothetical protein